MWLYFWIVFSLLILSFILKGNNAGKQRIRLNDVEDVYDDKILTISLIGNYINFYKLSLFDAAFCWRTALVLSIIHVHGIEPFPRTRDSRTICATCFDHFSVSVDPGLFEWLHRWSLVSNFESTSSDKVIEWVTQDDDDRRHIALHKILIGINYVLSQSLSEVYSF